MADYPTVKLNDLVPDGCNFKDAAFESYVRSWMDRMMPGFPLGLLDTESDEAMDRWGFETVRVHEVVEVSASIWRCTGCGEEYFKKPKKPCCDEDIQEEEVVLYVVVNTKTMEPVNFRTEYLRQVNLWEDYDSFPYDKKKVYAWKEENSAEEARKVADACYGEGGYEDRCGFPWANLWAYLPDSAISTEQLQRAGFVVASYVGGSGSWQTDETFRLAGIDGGGYSFSGHHFALLVALYHEANGLPVETDKGLAYVTTK